VRRGGGISNAKMAFCFHTQLFGEIDQRPHSAGVFRLTVTRSTGPALSCVSEGDRLPSPALLSLKGVKTPVRPAAWARGCSGLSSWLQTAPYDYYTVWLNGTILFGVASELELVGVHDWRGKYIVLAGAIDFSHDGSVQWCAENNLPLFIRGWDWRRKSGHAADPSCFFRQSTQLLSPRRYPYDTTIQNNVWLIGRSFGRKGRRCRSQNPSLG